MRTRIIPPTETEIALRKKLRLLAAHFAEVNRTCPTMISREPFEPNYLPAEVVTSLNKYVADHDIENADLMSLRQTPYAYHGAEEWVWMLHCYTNRYSGGRS